MYITLINLQRFDYNSYTSITGTYFVILIKVYPDSIMISSYSGTRNENFHITKKNMFHIAQ